MSEPPEFRVLAGRHKYARCEVENGFVIGSDENDDIVLSDAGIAPHAALVRLTESGWQLDIEGSADESALRAWSEPAALGQAWITVASSDAPWIELPDGESPSPVEDAGEAGQAPIPAQGASTARKMSFLGMRESVEMLGNAAAGAVPARRPSSVVLAGIVAVGAVAFIALLLVLFIVPSGTAKQGPRITPAQVLVQVNAVLDRLGLKNSLQVRMSPNGGATVTGWVRNGAERDTLAQALSQIWPMPGMQISVESEAIATAQAALKSFAVTYDVEYQGNGQLTVKGIAANATERAVALDAVRAHVPGMKIIGTGIRLAEDVSSKLANTFVNAGLTDIKLAWKDDRLTIQPPSLDDADEDRLVGLVAEFNKLNWNVAQLQRADPTVVANSVPFTIRSVIGGRQPFVVLADGSKLLIGGSYKKYRLVAVEDTHIIFDGVRRAVVPR